ncbi:metallophosphoesterase [Elusimicrobiota bacterium]
MFIIFLSAVLLVIWMEFRWIIHSIRKHYGKDIPPLWPKPLLRHKSILDIGLNVVFFLGALCILYGRFIEPGWIEVKTIGLESAKIDPTSASIKIAHLSDFHFDERALNAEKIIQLVNKQEPDIVVITGDYFNDTSGFGLVGEVIKRLKAPFGIYMVKGNYDHMDTGINAVLAEAPATWLKHGYKDVMVRNTKLRLIGMDVGYEPLFDNLMGTLPQKAQDPYSVFLCHYSDFVYKASELGIDLYLSGHTHGGQVRLPFYGAMMTLAKFGKRFESGMYKVGDTILYVSRGLGVEGGIAPRVRFLCRPEIVVFEIGAGI